MPRKITHVASGSGLRQSEKLAPGEKKHGYRFAQAPASKSHPPYPDYKGKVLAYPGAKKGRKFNP